MTTWHKYFEETGVETSNFLNAWISDEKDAHCKAMDTLYKSLRAVISKSSDGKKIDKANSLLSALQSRRVDENVKRIIHNNNPGSSNLQFVSCDGLQIGNLIRTALETEVDQTVSSDEESLSTPLTTNLQQSSYEYESPEESTTEKAEKSKTILSWGHVVDKIKISNISDHDWLANGYNISRDFREFQTQVVDRLKNNPTLSYATDTDEILCLSSIIYAKEDKPKYINCTDEIWKGALHRSLIPITLPVKVRLFMMEYNTLLMDKKALRVKWRQTWAECDDSMSEKEANIFECVQLVTRNFFLNISSSNTGDNAMDEDTFVHRYCHLMLEEIFNTTDYKLVWANGESSSSKERRKSDDNKHGRKPDFRVLFGEANEIIFGEIKPPRAPNNVVNHALIKLAEFMKGSLDSLHKRFGYSPCSETFGGVIKGFQVEFFSMDLAFDGLYRFKKIGRMLLPTEDANFLNLVTVISTFYSLLEKVDRSIEELNRPSTPTSLSYHRESNSSPHKVHIPFLKIPPPEIN